MVQHGRTLSYRLSCSINYVFILPTSTIKNEYFLFVSFYLSFYFHIDTTSLRWWIFLWNRYENRRHTGYTVITLTRKNCTLNLYCNFFDSLELYLKFIGTFPVITNIVPRTSANTTGLVGEEGTAPVVVHVASRVGLPLEEVTFASAFSAANYTTAAVGKCSKNIVHLFIQSLVIGLLLLLQIYCMFGRIHTFL